MNVPICNICKEILRGKSYIYAITENHTSSTLKYFEDNEDFGEADDTYRQDVYQQVRKNEQKARW